jgi:hypothetical protein
MGSRGTSIVYGIILILLGVEALLTDFISNEVLSSLVFIIGVAVLLTPIEPRPANLGGARGHPKAGYQWLRRWVFGPVLVLMGVGYFIDIIESWLAPILVDTLIGGVILLAMGLIYELASFKKTRMVQISSV